MKRNYIKSLMTMAVILLTNATCNRKLLNLPPPTASEATYFTSESAFKSAILGMYASLTDFYSSSNESGSGVWEGELAWLPGDDLTNGTGQPYEDFGNAINPSAGLIGNFFGSCYLLLGRANVVIQQLKTVKPGIFITPNLQNSNMGEALFLRAFGHYQLWNVFGTAPLDTIVVTSTGQLNAPSSTGTQLLDQAITDLTEAAALLPPSWDQADLGRVTANSAYGLLGKCLVFRASVTKNTADYQAALVAFGKISGVSLTTNFEDNFNVNTENNSESLFEFQAGAPIVGLGATNAWLANDQANIGVASSYWQCFENGSGTYMGGNLYYATAKLVGIFDPADPRLPLTVKTTDSTITKYVLNDQAEGSVNSLNNVRILRYADVLLLEAEATLQSGGDPAAAIGFINQVRTRARNMVSGGTVPANLDATVTDATTIMQWIMDERLRELACEGGRWFDLRRWAIGGTITLNNAFFSSQEPGRMAYDDHYLYFPIPISETSKNPNITQNKDY
ncbi:MAG: RagB/SusD family nutrient uptake outer membrane protein [Puia sp.]|nr:RagB/SusD family nutrient uptake outer membrane protein [Puia sp.]